MAITVKPTDWFGAGYSLGTNQILLNTANHGTPALPETNNTAANATTGNIEQVLYGILDKLYQTWVATLDANRPVQMVLTRSTSENAAGNIVRDYGIRFYLDENDALTVLAE